ncbi:MAG: 23S rRNA (adenine(2503)-C(2))-methyltransferase RlmN [Christensenellaceae bacterium]|nr:23S rRNA (adenine(2503)-C(2))-methyltransferase RlmN [Christensenellaceae bacterium]
MTSEKTNINTEKNIKESLQGLTFDKLSSFILGEGFPKYRVEQVYKMIMQGKDYDEATNIPLEIKNMLSKKYNAISVSLESEFSSKSGAKKYLYRLNDGNVIEGVFMPHDYGNTLCVSTQIGCRMNCSFCASGIGGLVRNLTADEIVGQVLLAERLNNTDTSKRAISNIVLMGSGEPLDNYENVVKFLSIITSPKGINISPRNISLSTVGLTDGIRRLATSGYSVTLAISLHAPTDEKRKKLIPISNKYKLTEVMEAAKFYFEKTKRRLIFEYALTSDGNTDQATARELINLLKGIPCHVNLIPLNIVDGKKIGKASAKQSTDFLDTLKKASLSVTIRRSLGDDIEGACGQLRHSRLAEQK